MEFYKLRCKLMVNCTAINSKNSPKVVKYKLVDLEGH